MDHEEINKSEEFLRSEMEWNRIYGKVLEYYYVYAESSAPRSVYMHACGRVYKL